MAVLTITAVATPASTSPVSILLGETVAAFDVVYKDTDNKYDLADNSTAAKYIASHIVLFGGGLDEYVVAIPLVRGVVLSLTGPTLTVGGSYVLSSTAGKIEDRSTLTTGDFINEFGIGKTTAQLLVGNYPTAIQSP